MAGNISMKFSFAVFRDHGIPFMGFSQGLHGTKTDLPTLTV